MVNQRLIKWMNLLLILAVSLSFSGCTILFTHKDFKKQDQRALFSADYNPDINNRLKSGVYLLYDESCKKYLKGGGYTLYPDGSVGYSSLKIDYLRLDEATPENIKRLMDADLIGYDTPLIGIYTVKNDKLYIDTYSNYLKAWSITQRDFTVINDFTISEDKIHYSYGQNTLTFNDRQYVYRYIPITILNSPKEQKLKKQKFLWSNKEDWKNYKSEQKNKAK